MNQTTEIMLIALLALGGYVLISHASAATAASRPASATGGVTPAPVNTGIPYGLGTAANTGASDLFGWLFGNAGNSAQTNSSSGTPVAAAGAVNSTDGLTDAQWQLLNGGN